MVEVEILGRQRTRAELLDEIGAALFELQTDLKLEERDATVIISGAYVVSGPAGPFDEFHISITVSDEFPWQEPMVQETAGRIPRTLDRHMFPGTDCCCLGVWEGWLAEEQDHSFRSFLTGPLDSYFVSQSVFELTGSWPFGERSHGEAGVLETYGDLLGTRGNKALIKRYLDTLSKGWPKGHWRCPCGSGHRLRQCHGEKLNKLHVRISPRLAKRMAARLT